MLPRWTTPSGLTPRPPLLAALAEPVTFKPKLACLLPVRLSSGPARSCWPRPAPCNTSGDFAGLVGHGRLRRAARRPGRISRGIRRALPELGLRPRRVAVDRPCRPIVPVPMAPNRIICHIDAGNRPQMVDVGGKAVTRRTAHAVAVVVLPPALAALLQRRRDRDAERGRSSRRRSSPGSWAPRGRPNSSRSATRCRSTTARSRSRPGQPRPDGSVEVEIHCRVRTQARTGVEMEALTGATRRRAHPLRHGQGGHARHRDPGDPAPGKDRRQERLPGAVNKTVRVHYFAILREQRGLDEEKVATGRRHRRRSSTRNCASATDSRFPPSGCASRSTTISCPGPRAAPRRRRAGLHPAGGRRLSR